MSIYTWAYTCPRTLCEWILEQGQCWPSDSRAGTFHHQTKVPDSGQLSQELGLKCCLLLFGEQVRREPHSPLRSPGKIPGIPSHCWWKNCASPQSWRQFSWLGALLEVRGDWLPPLLFSHELQGRSAFTHPAGLTFWILWLFSMETGPLPQLVGTEKQQGKRLLSHLTLFLKKVCKTVEIWQL